MAPPSSNGVVERILRIILSRQEVFVKKEKEFFQQKRQNRPLQNASSEIEINLKIADHHAVGPKSWTP
jgi:hypothetical protein